MSEEVSRRSALKYLATAVAGLAIGGAAAWSAKPTPPPPKKGKFAEAPPEGTEVTVIHGFDAAYPPYTEIDPTGKAVGFDVDVVNWIANKYGWKIQPKPWDWSTIMTALVAGDIDIIASGMEYTPARGEKAWYAIPYDVYWCDVVVLADEKRSLKDLLNSGGYISCQLGSTADEWADRLISQGYNMKKLALDSYALALQALLDKKAVAALSDTTFTLPYLKKNSEMAKKLKELTTLGGMAAFAIATRPEDNWLRNQINYGLRELMNDPHWNELRAKWDLV